MRRVVFASMMAVSCAGAQQIPTIGIPMPLAANEVLAPPPPRIPLPEPVLETRIRSSGMALVLDGMMLRAYVNVSDGSVQGGQRSVEKPEVHFFYFDFSSRKWNPIPGCQGVQECDISPYAGCRIRARFIGQGVAITGEFAP